MKYGITNFTSNVLAGYFNNILLFFPLKKKKIKKKKIKKKIKIKALLCSHITFGMLIRKSLILENKFVNDTCTQKVMYYWTIRNQILYHRQDCKYMYSQLRLSRLCTSRIIAYLEYFWQSQFALCIFNGMFFS